MNYIDLKYIKQLYEETSQQIIKLNIKELMKEYKTDHRKLKDLLGISLHTAYSYTNPGNKNKPELFNLLILIYFWGINFNKLFERE